jgi:hypothetical protein
MPSIRLVAAATIRRGEDSGKSSVFVHTIEQSENDRQTAAAQKAVAEHSVFRAENKQSDKDPKGSISLGAAIHNRNLLCFAAGDMYIFPKKGRKRLRFYLFYYIILRLREKMFPNFSFSRSFCCLK